MAKLVAFDIRAYYYIPHFTPVWRELARRGVDCRFVIYRSGDPQLQALMKRSVSQEALPADWVDGGPEALAWYRDRRPDWICFANAFDLDKLPPGVRTAQFWHGVGPKMIYYDPPLSLMDVRFVEGDHRLRRLREMYPRGNFVQTGFAKLDPMFRGEVRKLDLQALGLDPARPTLLYAPTFYPSSLEMFPDRWPAEFSTFNLIVKPHFFSWTSPKYKAQRRKLERWAAASNVYVARVDEDSLLPFMLSADVLISEASSSLYEFAALDRPIIWCDFLKLRWSYRGPLRFRFNRRMDPEMAQFADLGARAASYRQLRAAVEGQLAHPEQDADNRRRYTRELVGPTDGLASARIADYLLSMPEPKQE